MPKDSDNPTGTPKAAGVLPDFIITSPEAGATVAAAKVGGVWGIAVEVYNTHRMATEARVCHSTVQNCNQNGATALTQDPVLLDKFSKLHVPLVNCTHANRTHTVTAWRINANTGLWEEVPLAITVTVTCPEDDPPPPPPP